MSAERARAIQILLAVIGFGIAGLSQVQGLVQSQYFPWILRGFGGVLILGLLVLRRVAFVRSNARAGNRALAQHLQDRQQRGVELSLEQERFMSRLLSPWWRDPYWLIAGGSQLDPPNPRENGG